MNSIFVKDKWLSDQIAKSVYQLKANDLIEHDFLNGWEDFKNNEILSPFVYKILDDNLRNNILKEFFEAKEAIMKLKMNCNKQDQCTADYKDTSFEEVLTAFKSFLELIIKEYQNFGIEKLESIFFTPYGHQPNLKDIKL